MVLCTTCSLSLFTVAYSIDSRLSGYSDWLRAGRSGDRIPVGGDIFHTCPDLGPTQPPVQWVLGLSRVKKRPGRGADPSPPSTAVVKRKYSYTSTPPVPCGSYGLYRASGLVKVCTLPFTALIVIYTGCPRRNCQTSGECSLC